MREEYKYILKFLRANNYTLPFDDFYKQLSSHPDFPSLYSITDTFNFLGIDNIAASVPKDEFTNLPTYFLAVINNNNLEEIVYVRKKKDSIQYISSKKSKTITNQKFLDIWNGVIVAIDQNIMVENSSEISRKKTYLLLTILAILSGGGYFLLLNSSIAGIIFFLLSISGLLISIFIVRENLGIYSSTIEKICNSNSKTSCNDVLSSKGAKILKEFSLSDLCLIYFSSLLLVNIINPTSINHLSIFYLSIISILFITYSIFYQALIIKKWCVLCLAISAILILQFSILLFNYNYDGDLYTILIVLFSFSFIALLWLIIKEFQKKIQSLTQTEVEFLQFKKDRTIFELLIKSNSKVNEYGLSQLPSVQLGKEENAKVTLYGILSPSCGHCIKTFKEYLKLTEENSFIQVRLLFNINPENNDNVYTNVTNTIINSLINEGNQKALEMMHFWYESEFNLDKWKANYNDKITIESKQILQKQYEWCKENEINYSPATIFQSYVYPVGLKFSDLKFYLKTENDN